MALAKIIIDERDIEAVQVALRAFAQTLAARKGASIKATAKRLHAYTDAIRSEPKIVAEVMQVMDKAGRLVQKPVLYVNGALTEIVGARTCSSRRKAQVQANKHAAVLRRSLLQERW
jgi:hypothetical protein